MIENQPAKCCCYYSCFETISTIISTVVLYKVLTLCPPAASGPPGGRGKLPSGWGSSRPHPWRYSHASSPPWGCPACHPAPLYNNHLLSVLNQIIIFAVKNLLTMISCLWLYFKSKGVVYFWTWMSQSIKNIFLQDVLNLWCKLRNIIPWGSTSFLFIFIIYLSVCVSYYKIYTFYMAQPNSNKFWFNTLLDKLFFRTNILSHKIFPFKKWYPIVFNL